MKVEKETGDRRMMLFTLWIFSAIKYVYADGVTLFDKSVPTSVTGLSQTTLLGAAILVETAIAMVLLSRVLKYRANRLANIIVGAVNTVAVLASLPSCNSGSLLPVLCNHRSRYHTDNYLVRMDVAQHRMMRPSAFP